MAYIVSTLQTAAGSGATTYSVNFPTGSGAPVAGDTIVVLLTQDGTTESLGVGTSGFTALGTQVEAASATTSGLPFFKISTGGETSASFACTTAVIIGTAIVIRDSHATAPFGSVTDAVDYKRVEWTSANFADSPNGASALTTAVDECLLLYAFCSDGANIYMRCRLSEAVEVDKYQGSASSHIIGCNQQQTAGVAPTVRMLHNTAVEGGNAWVLAVRNKSGGALQPIPRASATDIKYYGSWATQHDGVTWQALDQFAASVNSITCSATGPTIDNTNFWTATGATYGANTRLTSTESTAGAWVGGTHTITSTNMTGKLFSVEMAPGVLSTATTTGSDGVLVGLSDGTNWATYQLITKAKGWSINDPDRYFIAIDTATPYATGGTWDATAKAAVTRVGYFFHRIGSSAGSANFAIKNAVLFDSIALTGGGSSHPVTFLDLQTYGNSWSLFRVALLQASSQVLARTSVQLGDDTNYTYFDGAAQSLEYPQTWSASVVPNWQMNWNAAANSVGLSVKAKDGDTIRLASGVAATDTGQNLSISSASAAYADATYSFAQSFVGWRDPVDNKGLTWTNATFKECGTVTIAGGGDLTNCTIAKTTSTHAPLMITANGTVVTTSTITVADTSITTDHHISLGASVTSCTLNGVTLSGAAGTDKIYSALTSGELTITVDGTGTSIVAGDVTFAAGTAFATIAAPQVYQKVTVSGITTGARVQIYDTTNSTELFNGTASAGDTVVSGSTVVWTDPAAASADRAIRIRVSYVSGVTAKNFIETSGLTCGQTSGTAEITYPVNPTDDTTYNTNAVDGSAVTGITFTDAATDLVNINIGANTVPLKDVYAAFVYWLFTAAGIDDDVAYIDAPDTANYIMTSMKFRNTSTSPLKITGGYFYDSTGSVENCVDTAGSSGNIFPMPEHVVPYQTTGTYAITGDLQDALDAIAGVPADVWADSKALTVPKFLGLK